MRCIALSYSTSSANVFAMGCRISASARQQRPGPTIKTTNDMPIVYPPSFDALGLVPFQINPHYFNAPMYLKRDDAFVEHFGENRPRRTLREFHEMNETPVIGLWEGGILRIENGGMELLGSMARVFRKGRDPVDAMPEQRLDELLG